MTAAAEAIREHGLVIEDVDELRLTAVRAPHLSVIRWLIAAGAPRGAQSAFGSMIALACPPRSARVLAALGTPSLGQLPEFIVPFAPSHDASVAANVTALRDARASELAAEVAGWSDPALPTPWRSAIDAPDDWRDDFAHAVGAAWAAGRRYWDTGRYAVDRELARIGTAVVTGMVPVLLNSLHPRLRFHDGVLRFRNSCPSTVPLDGRRLVLVPVLAPAHRLAVSFERPDVAYVAYPVLGRTQPARSDDDRLALVIGQVRAAALRSLVRPLSMQALAGELHCAPSTATYHCDLLDSAGLIARERRGSSIWVVRTRDGEALLDLLS